MLASLIKQERYKEKIYKIINYQGYITSETEKKKKIKEITSQTSRQRNVKIYLKEIIS